MAERTLDLGGLQALLERVRGLRAACVGDLMLDRYVYGEVDRISPEAPIPVLKVKRRVAMPGGVGNVARNVAALGGRARLGAVSGRDAAGDELAALIAAEGGVEDAVERRAGADTIVKTRFVAAGQQLLRLDEETATLPAAESDAFSGTSVVLLSDYAKGVVSDALIEQALNAARSTGAPVIVDPKGRDFARYGAVDLIKPNASELAGATGLPVGTDAEIEAALEALLAVTTARAVVVTRAGKGMSLMRRGEAAKHFPGRAREVFDVSGAGDTGLAALGLALGAGASLETAVEFAILASGVVVGKAGTATVSPAELIDAEMSQHAAGAHAKVMPLEELAHVVEGWKRQGLRVGFTNGCFDILHRGHVAYLAQARSWCDRLVVALNTDASVRRLKGEGRPINDLDSRAVVIGGLGSVDRVTSFDDPTPLALIERLRPDVLIKGADYTREGVVGGDLVESWGGEVKLATFEDGFSTTRTIEKMKDR
ncbi:MAG: D-glycero-beta-D-manno-heptose 1-phosphate adenylyltransferase [Alphaproteobacteria bacterium]|nr:D-glycero-beta-D-manno-heptose 1-phosphate adenylyltransferase [Alphaproteobacteria bacterium]MBU1525651.1 D-glycero-beta-D-manno-heptose 1-phosphate adenylyltransferase [Alphaproteobacteria bacterium]MBU2351968.1 D-glycero-beta-D-manno-heptose 1-phosphate adenylyltransferase [Alphaproteobacteria bacterium]MBU2383745.1 D-glycero-beta-D-manno-heptose 1-phosphate adenylyltransferase [Alphaproteobacteria bacterium]